MERATPAQMIKCLEITAGMAKHGIRFVPIPVRNDEEFLIQAAKADRILTEMIDEAEREEEWTK